MCNVTKSVNGIPPLVNDFFQNNFGGSGVGAFATGGSSVTAPASGDNYLTSGGNSILSWSDTTAPKKYTTFYGYSQGPGYWGKTFFVWPPEPSNITPTAGNTTAFPAWGNATTGWDWRKLYFLNSGGTAPVNSNLSLWSSGGAWNDPSGNYRINYKAILAWIKSGPNPFPSQLRAGKVLYYSSIPTDVPASAYDHTQSNSNITNADQRFWKEYIDYVVGVWAIRWETFSARAIRRAAMAPTSRPAAVARLRSLVRTAPARRLSAQPTIRSGRDIVFGLDR